MGECVGCRGVLGVSFGTVSSRVDVIMYATLSPSDAHATLHPGTSTARRSTRDMLVVYYDTFRDDMVTGWRGVCCTHYRLLTNHDSVEAFFIARQHTAADALY